MTTERSNSSRGSKAKKSFERVAEKTERLVAAEDSSGGIQEFKKGGSLECAREKFRVTTPTFAKPRLFSLKLAFMSCTTNRLLHCMHIESEKIIQ